MPWNGSGTYAPPAASFPEVTGTTIDAARFNATINDLATGVTAALTRNGENAATANLPMGGYKHTGAAAGAIAGEYVTWNQAGVQFPALGIGVASSPWAAPYAAAIDFSPTASIGGYGSGGGGVVVATNTYYDGASHRAKTTGGAALISATNLDGVSFYTAPSVSAGAIQTFVERARVNANGVGVGVIPSPWAVQSPVDLNTGGAVFGSPSNAGVTYNSYNDGTHWRAKFTGGAAYLSVQTEEVVVYTAASVTACSEQTYVPRLVINSAGMIPTLNTSVPTLSSNLQMVFTLTSNTNLRISVRGSDGTTRVANITLA